MVELNEQAAVGAPANVAWLLGAEALPQVAEPNRAALLWTGHSRTYAELRQRALSLAYALRARGLQPGDRVAVLAYNRGETFELYFACAFAGLTLVPINFRLVSQELAYVLTDSGAKVLLYDERLEESASTALDLITQDVDSVRFDATAPGAVYDEMATGPQLPLDDFGHTDVHLLLYTSGTTGRPKGVMLSHRAILWFAMQQACAYPGMDPTCVTLITGPIYNTAGIHEQSIPVFLVGGAVAILESGSWTARKLANAIDEWSVTSGVIYPSMMGPLLEADRESPFELGSFRFTITGGENCPHDLLARFRKRWPHISVAIGYGLTEGGIATFIRDCDMDDKPHSVGRAFPGSAFKVVDDKGTRVPSGTIGDVWMASPSQTVGVWGDPAAQQEVLRDGWVVTGDLGYVDEDGYLYIAGRSKDMIISKGQNIYSAEVESALSECPQLLEASVIGVPDSEYGEAVCAVVVVKPGTEFGAADITAFSRSRLASYKKPRYLLVVDSLPRNPSQKVDKVLLRAQVGDGDLVPQPLS